MGLILPLVDLRHAIGCYVWAKQARPRTGVAYFNDQPERGRLP